MKRRTALGLLGVLVLAPLSAVELDPRPGHGYFIVGSCGHWVVRLLEDGVVWHARCSQENKASEACFDAASWLDGEAAANVLSLGNWYVRHGQ